MGQGTNTASSNLDPSPVTKEKVSFPDLQSDDEETSRFKARFYRAVRARWHVYAQSNANELAEGSVKFKFFIRSDGIITNLEIIKGKQFSKIGGLGRRSIMEVSGQLQPFSENMKRRVGEGFVDDLTFTIETSKEPELAPDWASKWKM